MYEIVNYKTSCPNPSVVEGHTEKELMQIKRKALVVRYLIFINDLYKKKMLYGKTVTSRSKLILKKPFEVNRLSNFDNLSFGIKFDSTVENSTIIFILSRGMQ